MIHLLPDESTVTESCSDGLLVLNLTSLRYTFFDPTGAQMWAALRSSSGLEEAVDRLCSFFAANRAILRRDLLAYCDLLVAEGLAARTPYQVPAEALADPSPTEAEVAPHLDWAAGLLGAVVRDDVMGDIILLDVPAAAVAQFRQAVARVEVDDLKKRLVVALGEAVATTPGTPVADICLLWIHTTDGDVLAHVLHKWLAHLSPGGYVVVSGLEPQVLAKSVATVGPPVDGSEIVPVDWLTVWWQQR